MKREMELEDINNKIIHEKEELDFTKGKYYKVEKLDDLDNKELERELVNLPNLEFDTKVKYVNLELDLKFVQQQIQQILDDTILQIVETEKSQYTTVRQRDARSSQILRDSKRYFALQTLENILQQHISFLKTECDYYAKMCQSLKKIYSIRNEVLMLDKKVNKGE